VTVVNVEVNAVIVDAGDVLHVAVTGNVYAVVATDRERCKMIASPPPVVLTMDGMSD